MIRKAKRAIRHMIGLKNDTDYYSQGGEDAIASKSFLYVLPVKNGFYVDIGSYHPYRFSNTYILYRNGWRGINIDPRPGSKALFDKYRSRDINVEVGIGGSDGKMTYYMLNESSTMNTFSRENLEKLGLIDKIEKTVDVPVLTMSTLMKKYPEITTIDFLNIDTEGFEMEILAGLDFNKTPPKVIAIEQNNVFSLQDVLSSEPCRFLESKGYFPYAKNVILTNVATVFYMNKNALPQQS